MQVPGEVNPRWELSAVQKRLEVDRRLPVLQFQKVIGSTMPVISNLFASKTHLALALETTPEKVIPRFTDAQVNGLAPRNVSSGPVKDVVLAGDNVDLNVLPIVTHCEKDAGPYLSSGVTIMRDPVSGSLNAGIYRNLVTSPTT